MSNISVSNVKNNLSVPKLKNFFYALVRLVVLKNAKSLITRDKTKTFQDDIKRIIDGCDIFTEKKKYLF